MTTPTAIPDESPSVGEVLYVVPGALVRRPAFAAGGTGERHAWAYDPAGPAPVPASSRRIRPLLASLPPGLADQIERAAAECAASAPVGEVLYAACWCDDDDHTFADHVQWRESVDRARRDRDESAHPAHLIRRITVTEAVA